jgi:enoyl-CoA hydratase/carnithine racemase
MAKAYTERVVAMSTVDFETIGSLAIVTINRAHTRNAIDRPTAEGLADVGFAASTAMIHSRSLF